MGFLNSTAFVGITFVGFTALVAILSYFYTKGTDESSEGGYYLAGRSLPGIVIAGSLIMTDLSAVQLIGNNGQAVQVGMGVFAAQGLGFTGMVLAAILVIPRYLRAGIITMPEFYEIRYDKFTRNMVTIIMMLSYMIVMLPSTLYAGAEVFITIFSVDTLLGWAYFPTLVMLCIAIALIGSAYALFGGLKAIAFSDTVNGVGMIIGGIAVTIFGMVFLSQAMGGDGSFLDGLDKLTHTDPAMMNAWNPATSNEPWWPWPIIFTGLTVNNLYYWGCDQAIVQRAFGAKNMANAQKGMIYAGLLTFVTAIFLVIPGITARFAFSDINFYANGDSAFPILINSCLPKPILGFFAACMFGAILSTFNSMLNSACTIFSLNIYQDIINPNASDARVVRTGKIYGVIVTVLSTAIAPFLSKADGILSWLNMALGLFNTPILVITLFAVFSKKAPRNLGKIVIPIHIVLYFLVNYALPHVIPFFGAVHYLYYTLALFIIDTAIAFIVTNANPLKEDYELPYNPPSADYDMTPWKYRYHVIGLTLAITAVIYIVFSPLGLAKGADQSTWQNYQDYQASAIVEVQE